MKKSQIKFGETFGVMIIMYFVIIFGIKFYEGYLKDNIEEIRLTNEKLLEEEKFTYFSKLNYLKYSISGIYQNEFDIHSLRAYSNYSKNYPLEVEKKLGFSNASIKVLKINFSNSDFSIYTNETINLFENVKDDFKSKTIYRTLYPIRDTSKEETYIGILEVVFFS